MKHAHAFAVLLPALLTLAPRTAPVKAPSNAPEDEVQLEIAKIYFEYNSSANDLGVHVFLDGEDWRKIRIRKPSGATIFDVVGWGPYATLGMTELFFEGAEPSLDDVPLSQLLGMFPQGEYEFSGRTVDGLEIEGEADLSHAIPAGPVVSTVVGPGNLLRIRWNPVSTTPPGFPALPVSVVGYQVIVGKFQVTLPATATQATVSPEFVASLAPGVHDFEVLAIEASGNQTITEGTFVKP